jgi:hypothetical protein
MFEMIEKAAEQQGWIVLGIVFFVPNAQDPTHGVILFRQRAGIDRFGTAEFKTDSGDTQFFWGHYDKDFKSGAADFATRTKERSQHG